MHTYRATETTFHYNSDFSGDVIAICKITGEESHIHGEDILRFVADCYISCARIAQIEGMSWCELLGDVSRCNKPVDKST